MYKKVKDRITLVLYPEGGTLYAGSKAKSVEFAKKLGVQPLKHLLLPRERGFTEIVKHAEVDCIYDVTLGMPENIDGTDAGGFGFDTDGI